jgi:archaeal flagellin FlaB
MFSKAIRNLHRGQKGITGLETAIILIAFVTVAAVLAYTVLSAGIFSSERGKEAVYSGLESAQSTLGVKGSVLVISTGTGDTATKDLQFTLAMSTGAGSVDLTKLVFNYWDSAGANDTAVDTTGDTTFVDASDGTTKITSISGSQAVLVTLSPTDFKDLTAYDTFTLQIITPTGATVTIQRTMPGDITPSVLNLN